MPARIQESRARIQKKEIVGDEIDSKTVFDSDLGFLWTN
jgi:hypothetical protein